MLFSYKFSFAVSIQQVKAKGKKVTSLEFVGKRIKPINTQIPPKR